MPAVFAGDLRAGPCAIRHQIRSVRALVPKPFGGHDAERPQPG